MSTAIAQQNSATALESVLIGGDLSKLQPEQRIAYYKAVCESVGLNPLTKPFDYLTLSGKTVLYAKRDATDQLRKIHGVSLRVTGRETIEGVYVVTAAATDSKGRTDESTGAVTIAGLRGDGLANAFMKAETKAKRRVTLSICGLGLLDETEIETIPNAVPSNGVHVPPVIANRTSPPPPKHASTDKGDAWEPEPISRDTQARIWSALAILKMAWTLDVTERASKVIGRQIAPTEELEHLSEEEGVKLANALAKKIDQMQSTT
jgi:hypothetical protein